MTDDRQITVTHASPSETNRYGPAICDLYDEVFSAPPFNWSEGESERHRGVLERMVCDSTFGLALARANDELVGFVYGSGLHSDTKWWNGFRDPVPDDLIREAEGRTFAVIDLAVREPMRRQGLGRRLLTTLLGGRPEQRATLAVQPQVAGSHAFYAAIGGWELIGRQDTPGYVSSEFDIYVRTLNP